MAGKPGSTVIICTDGLANKGLGTLDNPDIQPEPFYNEVGELAK
jgi:hypothetical protein